MLCRRLESGRRTIGKPRTVAAVLVLISVALAADCAPSGGTGAAQPATPDANLNGGYGDFSFEITDQDATTNGTDPPGADAEAGATLYGSAEQACAVCHGTYAEGAAQAGPLVETSAARLEEVLGSEDDHQNVSRPPLTDEDYLNLEAFLVAPGQDAGSNGVDADTTDSGTNGGID